VKTKAVVSALLLLGAAAAQLYGIEVTQFTASAHAYPVMRDLDGKELGDGEFTQEIRDHLLRIRIAYDLRHGHTIEEKAAFAQDSALTQKEWSWQERRDGDLEREYKVDFDAGKATSRKREDDGLKERSDEVKIEPGTTFAGFGLVLALQNLRDRLVKGEAIELRAVGFTPGPRVVSVKLTHAGIDRMRMSSRVLRGEHFLIHPEIPWIAKLFLKVPDTDVWLTPPPSGFLRWQGPLAEPSDPVVRVDLSSGGESGPAESADKEPEE
jgi:hypothetical protein